METLIVIAIVCGCSLLIPGNPVRNLHSKSGGKAPVRSGCSGCACSGACNTTRVLVAFFAITVMSGVGAVQAADTVETWDVGATDFDFYVGTEGIGQAPEEGMLFGDIMLGYGLIERFSAYLGMTFQSDRNLDQSDPQFYLGLFGTPLASDHVDLDLFLDLSSSSSEAAITPAFELNLDHDPDQRTFGAYLRSGIVFKNQPADPEVADSTPKIGTTIEINPGVYWSLWERGQILLEYSTGYFPTPAAEEDRWDSGHLHLGYNHTLIDALELITEVNWLLEKNGDRRSWGAFVGIIATLPSAGN